MSAAYKHLDKSAGVQLSAKNWADAYAGVTQTAEKFFIENVGDRPLVNVECRIVQVGTNDGNSFLRIGADTATILKPYGLAAALSATGQGGVWSGTGAQYFKITAIGPTGETTPTDQVAITVDDTTKKVTLTWSSVPGATGYKVYRSTTSGVFSDPCLRATVAGGGTVTYVDDGTAVGAGAPPSINTTAGGGPTYGTAPALGAGPITVGTLAIGQQWAYWVNWVIPGATDEAGNPRMVDIDFVEIPT